MRSHRARRPLRARSREADMPAVGKRGWCITGPVGKPRANEGGRHGFRGTFRRAPGRRDRRRLGDRPRGGPAARGRGRARWRSGTATGGGRGGGGRDRRLAVPLDVTDWPAVEAAAERTAAALGGIDVLVCSAGITGPTVPVAEFPVDGFRAGLRGQRLRALPLQQGGGAGDAGRRLRADRQHRLGRRQGGQSQRLGLLRVEGGGDRLHQVARQGTRAARASRQLRDAGRGADARSSTRCRRATSTSCCSKIPMGRFGSVEEIAALVCWVASEECSFTTGVGLRHLRRTGDLLRRPRGIEAGGLRSKVGEARAGSRGGGHEGSERRRSGSAPPRERLASVRGGPGDAARGLYLAGLPRRRARAHLRPRMALRRPRQRRSPSPATI